MMCVYVRPQVSDLAGDGFFMCVNVCPMVEKYDLSLELLIIKFFP